MSSFEKILNIYMWIKIFLSPFVVGLLLAFVSWFKYDNLYGHIGAMLFVSAGTMVGIRFAENMRKNYGDAFASGSHVVPEGYEKEYPKL